MVTPGTLRAGLTTAWTLSLPAFPAPAWSVRYYLRKDAAAPVVLNSTAAGVDHVMTATLECPPGRYTWEAVAINVALGVNTLVGTGIVNVLPDPASTYDPRTPVEMALAAIDAVLAGRLSDPLAEYEIDGVRAKRIPPQDLLNIRDRLRRELRRQRGGPTVWSLPA